MNHDDNTNLYEIYGIDSVSNPDKQIETNKQVIIQGLEKYKAKIHQDFDEDQNLDQDKKQIIGHKYHKEDALQQLNDVIDAIK